MRALGLLLVLLGCLTFALILLAGSADRGDDLALALLASSLMVSGSVLAGAAALGRLVSVDLPASGPADPGRAARQASDEAAAPPEPAIRRPGYHRRAA